MILERFLAQPHRNRTETGISKSDVVMAVVDVESGSVSTSDGEEPKDGHKASPDEVAGSPLLEEVAIER
ncbi:MAG: hypothetical protein H8D78_10450 [Chloroflexi bacterium]|nr:hypothetical protein [Chloroflexota bacterium]